MPGPGLLIPKAAKARLTSQRRLSSSVFFALNSASVKIPCVFNAARRSMVEMMSPGWMPTDGAAGATGVAGVNCAAGAEVNVDAGGATT